MPSASVLESKAARVAELEAKLKGDVAPGAKIG